MSMAFGKQQKGDGPAIPERCDWNIGCSTAWCSDGSSHGEAESWRSDANEDSSERVDHCLVHQGDLGKTVAVQRHASNGSQSVSRVSSKNKSADRG